MGFKSIGFGLDEEFVIPIVPKRFLLSDAIHRHIKD
jgi:hypothetical protein